MFLVIVHLNREVETKRDEKVKLLTIHKSKGMEYPVVFIIGCNEELLPHHKNKNVDDERRLFYVAITRAKKKNYIFPMWICITTRLKISVHSLRILKTPLTLLSQLRMT